MGNSSASRFPSEQSRPSSPSALETSTLTPRSPSTTVTTAPSSPTHQHPSTALLLDDIFGSSPPNQHQHSLESNNDNNNSNNNNNIAPQPHQRDLAREPSDLPFLRRQHVTAGYRDGISVAKGEHVQRGFDGGFPVGAELGLRVGTVLGVLEGLVATAAVAARRAGGGRGDGDAKGSGTWRGAGDDIAAMFEAAKKELSVQNVFGAAAEDVGGEGVAEQTGNGNGGDGDGGGGRREWVDPCVRLAKAGDEVVTRWEGRVRELLAATR
ncbi:essential protein Yae1, variant 2 [Blastomyces dermatitidis ER-3]|uniref:Protein YAE1 n=1 Tax=Ajellomyces dermatitidis (strain ER-3 / ATCC MYA-2586) TaxID=559297 RepID=A0ABM9YFM8_AJEDR|nr:essential protein Yae1 [Blastomyces dermatitidis ER-3]XP_045279511.1 essential protein Yae1, variant 1 [Blastomyces dermatitidis ER-3]XP_045279512.1 essential protein Yae1, variant 2 [Blastomyces dermatitidis ER-3]EEQ84488.1 essential protein Yae1 [Blastomyces dermatitidis ER-3]OAS99783.1 essential protein Yae1, variant 1 [Blastomyces dermatitidis ER-3]OAS99784.1 essential protein Yae1, variant 2 [Blastomyces dermatitidis ER-3]